MIKIRKLAAVDMAWLGIRVVVAEYALGVILPLFLGILSIRSGLLSPVVPNWETILGFWLVAISANYIPLLIYAVLIAKSGTAKKEGDPELVHAKKYALQQTIILVPFLVVLLALLQGLESRRIAK